MFGHDSFLEGQTALFSNAKNIFYSGFYAAFSACACSLCPLGCFHHGSADEDKAYAMLFDSAGESDIALLKEILPRIKTSWWREYALSRM